MPAASHADVRLARACLAAYLLFLVYGSFFPFQFAADARHVQEQLSRVVLAPWAADGHRNFSLPDVASNVLLGLPFGFLLVLGRLAGGFPGGRIFRAGVLDLVVAGLIEAGQVFTVDRTASAIDVVAQVAGSLAGAVAAQPLLQATGEGLVERGRRFFRDRPLAVPLVVLLVAMAADALYPYAPTLDVSTVWGSVKRAAWSPLHLPPGAAWHGLVVDWILPYAVVGALAVLVLSRLPLSRARLLAWLFCGIYSTGLELGKLLVEGRSPAMHHVLLAAVGAGLGVLAAPRHVPGPSVLAGGAMAVMAYEELVPFNFVWSLAHLRARMADAEWLPFASYYWAEPEVALFDAGKKLLLGGFVGSTLGLAGVRAPTAWALGLGALLEAAQCLERSHRPAVGDALILAAGAALGARLLARHRPVLDSRRA
jgi:VanZ family protein